MRMARQDPEVVFDRVLSGGHGPARAPALQLARALAVRIPATPDEVDALGRAGLLPEEWQFAATLPPLRRSTWIGGRVAARIALDDLGVKAPPLFSDDRGAP